MSASPAGAAWHIDHDAMSWAATGAIDRRGRWIGSPHCTSHDPIFWRSGHVCSVCDATTDLRPWDERRFICDRCTRENPPGLSLHDDGRWVARCPWPKCEQELDVRAGVLYQVDFRYTERPAVCETAIRAAEAE